MINKSNGFTLIEVLVAMVISSFGLLGLAGLQTVSLKYSQSSYNRSLATQLAYDISDRIRTNGAQATYITQSTTTATQKANCLNTTGCLNADMAMNDLYEFNLRLSELPHGNVSITNNSGIYTITINWDDNRNGIYTDDPNFSTNFKI